MTDNRITRRQLALTASAAAAAMFPLRVRAQQNYPSRPVRFILPFAAAGVADITARLAAEKLGDGQRFVVENQPGPGGIAAARAVLSQAPDGYTIGLVTNGTSISAAIYRRCRSIRSRSSRPSRPSARSTWSSPPTWRPSSRRSTTS